MTGHVIISLEVSTLENVISQLSVLNVDFTLSSHLCGVKVEIILQGINHC